MKPNDPLQEAWGWLDACVDGYDCEFNTEQMAEYLAQDRKEIREAVIREVSRTVSEISKDDQLALDVLSHYGLLDGGEE
jgi:hypothetical protein